MVEVRPVDYVLYTIEEKGSMKSNVVPILMMAGAIVVIGFIAQEQEQEKQPAPVQQKVAPTLDPQITYPQPRASFGGKIGNTVEMMIDIDDSEAAHLHLTFNEEKVAVIAVIEEAVYNRPTLRFRSRNTADSFSLYRNAETGRDATCDGCWRITSTTPSEGIRDEVVDQTKLQEKIDAL